MSHGLRFYLTNSLFQKYNGLNSNRFFRSICNIWKSVTPHPTPSLPFLFKLSCLKINLIQYTRINFCFFNILRLQAMKTILCIKTDRKGETYEQNYYITSWRTRRCPWKKNWTNNFRKIIRIFLAYNIPRPPMSVHTKFQLNRFSRLARYRQHIHIRCLVLLYR